MLRSLAEDKGIVQGWQGNSSAFQNGSNSPIIRRGASVYAPELPETVG
jgi:hypothetical protein